MSPFLPSFIPRHQHNIDPDFRLETPVAHENMLPTALKETVVLVVFGITLVPIAAKRAHFAPASLQEFKREPMTSEEPHNSSCRPRGNGTGSFRDAQVCLGHRRAQSSEQLTDRSGLQNNGVLAYAEMAGFTVPEASTYSTVSRSQSASGEAFRTPTVTTADAARIAEATVVFPATLEQELTTSDNDSTLALPPTQISNAGKERLIWMGAAITSVAMFMSSC